jgi:hypothetical protein
MAHDVQLAAAEGRQRSALERQRVELTGSVSEQMALLERQDRERRLETMSQRAVRRMANGALPAATPSHFLH